MKQASVGFHCPNCVRQSSQKVVRGPAAFGVATPVVTIGLIAINVLIFFYEQSAGDLPYWTAGGPVDAGEWWRLLTGGFLHGSMAHVGMNMYSLWILGRIFEKNLGPRDYLITYVGALFAGSLGVIVATSSAQGASGAIFGLLAMLVMLYRSRGISLASSGLMPILGINAFVSFLPGISLAGHLGGFLGGLAFGAIWYQSEKILPSRVHRTAAAVALAVVLFAGGVLLA